MAFDVVNGVTGAVNGVPVIEKPTKSPAPKPDNATEKE